MKVNSDLGSFAIVDAHGYYIEHGNNINLKDVDWSPDYTSKEILETSGNAVILIRNPFEALYAYRHLTYGSHAGDTTAYQFFGKGNKICEFTRVSAKKGPLAALVELISYLPYRLG